MKIKWAHLFVLIIISVLPALLELTGQVKTSNSKENNTIAQIQRSIDQTNQLIVGSNEEKKQLLKRLDLLQSQILYRKELQEKLSMELQSTETEMQQLKKQNVTNKGQLELLQSEYNQLLKYKVIHRLTYNPILTLLQPGKLDENVKIWYLLEKIERERQQTLHNLQISKSSYLKTLEELTLKSFKQDSLLHFTKKEEANILSDITKSKFMIQELSGKESGLNAELIAYKKKKDEFNKLIETSMNKIAKTKDISKSVISKNIKYPLKDGTIISRFGKNMDAGKSKLLIRNNGIDLQSKYPFVSVSTNSEVVEIRKMPNQSYLLITKTGNLFVVYSNLESVLLRNGEKVEQGVNLGRAAKNDEGFFEVHFETWIEKTPIDPLQFLKN